LAAPVAAGYIVGWADLFVGGLRGYWLWTSLVYVAGLLLLSLSANSELPAWVGRYVQVSPEFAALAPLGALAGSTATAVVAVANAGQPAVAPRMHVSNGVLSAWRPLDRDQVVVPVAAASGGTQSGASAAPLRPAAAAAHALFASLFRGGGASAPQQQQQQQQQQGLLGARYGPATASTEAAVASVASAHAGGISAGGGGAGGVSAAASAAEAAAAAAAAGLAR
jgi:hypothetical protein